MFQSPMFRFLQAEFFNHAVQAILALYDDGDVSVSSVMIVGHSLGGIVARLVKTKALVNAVLTESAHPAERSAQAFLCAFNSGRYFAALAGNMYHVTPMVEVPRPSHETVRC